MTRTVEEDLAALPYLVRTELAERTVEPLPYPHHIPTPGYQFACTIGERHDLPVSSSDTCPGCVAWTLATALKDPWRPAYDEDTNVRTTALAFARRALGNDDPMRVLFERAVADLGIGITEIGVD